MKRTNQVCLLGGTGFIGQSIVRQLMEKGYSVKVLSRRRESHRELLVLPNVEVIETDVYDGTKLQTHFSGMDAVINLVGIRYETDKKTRNFQTAHVGLSRKVIDACRNSSVRRLLHMSALQSDANRGPSKYLRTKGEAENMVHTTANINVTTFRPSVIFGPNDVFLNRFAMLFHIIPEFIPFPLACPKTRFAPLYVEDLASVFVNAINNKSTHGQRYNLCGPKVYSLKELVEYVAKLLGQKRKIIGLGNSLSHLQAAILGNLPGRLITTDNVASMQVDSVCDTAFPSIFGITPRSIESIAPRYLASEHTRGQFSRFRRSAGRDNT